MKANEWIDIMAQRLQQRWPSVEPARLDELAADLWTDERLRAMAPGRAADEWLRPVALGSRPGTDTPATADDRRAHDLTARSG